MGFSNSGRRKQPAALKRLRGNPSKDRVSDREAKAPAGMVTMPPGLSPGAEQVWNRLAPICLEMGTLTIADVDAFVTMSELIHTRQVASQHKCRPDFSLFLHTTMVDSAGNEHQQVKVHPAIKLEADTAVKLRPYFDYFGLTPSGRPRIQIRRPDEPRSKWLSVAS